MSSAHRYGGIFFQVVTAVENSRCTLSWNNAIRTCKQASYNSNRWYKKKESTEISDSTLSKNFTGLSVIASLEPL